MAVQTHHRHMTQRQQKRFDKAKENIDRATQYFKENYDRFNKFCSMVFRSTLTAQQKMFLLSKNRPIMEWNILLPPISRLRGEFGKHQVEVKVNGKNGQEIGKDAGTFEDIGLIDFVEGHMRYQFHDMKVNGVEYDLMTDVLVGGFAGAKVWHDYEDPYSFDQRIYCAPVWDATLFGFDPMAKDKDKNDGEFFFEAYPQNKEKFEEEYKDVDLEGLAEINAVSSLKWSYHSQNEDIVLLVDYYYKKKKKKKLVLLSNGESMLMDEYKEFEQEWRQRENIGLEVRQIPQIVDERMTEVCSIHRMKMIGTQILEEEETDLPSFPYVYIDGNSELIKNPDNSYVQYMTRPYVYDAVGAQNMRNFAGQNLIYGMMKQVQSPFMASTDNLRGQDAEPWRNPQDANVLTYNAYKDDNPEIPLQPPIPIQPQALPPEIMQTFEISGKVCEESLGAFDASLAKLTEHETSGKAYSEIQSMSNAAAKPYVDNMILGIQSIAAKFLELIPMVYTTPRSIPILDAQGRKKYVKINQEGGITINFRPHDLEVKIEAGASFGIQQDRALQALNATAKAFPGFAEFIHAKGLHIITDNLRDIRGSEELIMLAEEYTAEMEQMKQMMAGQPNPEQAKTDLAREKLMMESQLSERKMMTEDRQTKIKALTDIGKLKIDKEKNKVEMLKAFADINQSRKDSMNEENSLEFEKLKAGLELMHERLQLDYDEMERNFQRAITKHEMNKPEKIVNEQ
jgi:hypothetical protein